MVDVDSCTTVACYQISSYCAALLAGLPSEWSAVWRISVWHIWCCLDSEYTW